MPTIVAAHAVADTLAARDKNAYNSFTLNNKAYKVTVNTADSRLQPVPALSAAVNFLLPRARSTLANLALRPGLAAILLSSASTNAAYLSKEEERKRAEFGKLSHEPVPIYLKARAMAFLA